MNTQVHYHRRRLADTAAALRLARTQTSREQGPRAQLASHQQQRLETVVRHAAAHSPFYRRWYAETGPLGNGPVELQRLPVLDKSLLMEHFDELVCDPRLRRDELLDWAGQLTRDQLYLDRYRVMLTSGSSGRLRLSLRILVTVGELRTPEMTQRLVDAFGVRPFDAYGCTEGLFGSECQHHQGIHLFEDTTLVENVDPDGCPVAAGQSGARLLVTNLYNLVQPLLRLEVTDLVTLDPDPCPCGRTLVRARAIHGRSDDLLSLPARDGGRVAVHPLQFALLTRDPQVREFQVVQDGPALRILIVPSPAVADGDDQLETRLGQAVTQQLLKLGVQDPQISVERRPKLPRSAGGKLKLVIADPASRPVHTNTR